MSIQISPPLPHTACNNPRYDSLDGLRAYAAIGIILMHVLANITIKPSENYLTSTLIPFCTDFTLFFMIISGFSLCCGYYEQIKNGTITPNRFYQKRYARILPYFATLCLLDLALSPGLRSVYETFANLTLCFNLLPQMNIEVIGVGWFLGVVFLFYLLFPFFVFMIHNKRRAWFSMAVALLFVLIATLYAEQVDNYEIPNRTNMVFCMPLFLAGGLAYLYRKQAANFTRKYQWPFLIGCTAYTTIFFLFPTQGFLHYLSELMLFAGWLVYAIGSHNRILNNRPVRYLSGISMEIYLAHMVFFRMTERIHVERFITQPDWCYIVTCLIVIGSVTIFAHIMKYHVLTKVIKMTCSNKLKSL